MSGFRSALYVGSVMHHRVRPKTHRLRYRLFSLLLDLDELPRLARSLRFFSLGRFNLLSFYPCDHGADDGHDLRAEVEGYLQAAGVHVDGGPIRLFTVPRILGYGFNPLSIFFCHRKDESLAAILYEVSNTFGQRHSYLFAVEPDADGTMRHECRKEFYVSPFIAMDMTYAFRITSPGETFAVRIRTGDGFGILLTAVQTARRVDLSDAALLRVFFTHPLLTLKVIFGIHLEALVIWLKGVGLQARPPPPRNPVTAIVPRLDK
jgi:hypothetical protein